MTNPPGEPVPHVILDLLGAWPYLSTACDTGIRIETGPYEGHRYRNVILPDAVTSDLLENEIWRLHKRCRETHKFTGRRCNCLCHGRGVIGVMAACPTCRGRRIVPEPGNWNHEHGEPRPRACPDCQE
jgi:hypothetical protein